MAHSLYEIAKLRRIPFEDSSSDIMRDMDDIARYVEFSSLKLDDALYGGQIKRLIGSLPTSK